jgi:hypothetical protein
MVLRGTFGTNWEEEEENGANCIMRSITICTPCQTLLRCSNNVKRIVVVISEISLTKAKKHTDIKTTLRIARRTSNHVT